MCRGRGLCTVATKKIFGAGVAFFVRVKDVDTVFSELKQSLLL